MIDKLFDTFLLITVVSCAVGYLSAEIGFRIASGVAFLCAFFSTAFLIILAFIIIWGDK